MDRQPLSPSPRLPTGSFDVMVLAGSAGGHAAVIHILENLPPEFSVPVVVMLHLGAESTNTTEVLGRRVRIPLAWAAHDTTLAPGKGLICPPKSFLELLPDGTCVLAPNERGATAKPIERLLESVARSFGERAIAVILTGMQSDGALGARQLHLAGGTVVVQSEATSEYPDMPRAAIKAAAADFVVPLQDIGPLLADIVAGTPQPLPRSEAEAIRQIFGEKGKVAALAREIDWSRTGFGPLREWSPVLRSMVRLAIESPNPVTIDWGPHHLVLVNDAALPFLDVAPLDVLARPRFERWPETAARTEPILARVLAGEQVTEAGVRVPYRDQDRAEDAWFDLAYTPIHDAQGKIIGVFEAWHARTGETLSSRRLRMLHTVTAQAGASNRLETLERALAALQGAPDVLFAAAYQIDPLRVRGTLVGAVGVEEGSPLAPHTAAIPGAPWPFDQVIQEREPLHLDDLATRFPGQRVPAGPGEPDIAPEGAYLCPLRDRASQHVVGVLVFGLHPRLRWDDLYRESLRLVAQTVEAQLVESSARHHEHENLERLAELDRTKTEFFANISHEFRTPLTLLLAPLEDLRRHRDELPAPLREGLEVAAHNSRRLLRLVNSLLDFSQTDARRQQVNFQPTDLGALTTDIASAFRSAVEAAGLGFHVRCDVELQPVWVDRDMWEWIVSNLLSNAIKFTFEGEIEVELRALHLHAQLVVRDTGIGVPPHEVPNLFKRFHRVRDARARTAEGSGIGLSIARDLVQRLGGQIRVRSKEGQGTEFTVWIPFKTPRVTQEAAAPQETGERRGIAHELARDASRWLAHADAAPAEVVEDLLGPPRLGEGQRQGTILVADDNADMRSYLKRLLRPRWDVALAVDGEEALRMATLHRPSLILADVMMPGLDGFQLVKRVREDEDLRHTPIVLVTARVGEEAAIQGLLAGADDYIAKPFSPRELVARIQAVVDRAQAEVALRAAHQTLILSERRLQRVLETDAVGVLFFDDQGTVIRANDVFLRMTGYTQEQIDRRQLTWRTMTPPEWVRVSEDQMDECGRSGRIGPYEKEYFLADGSRRWMLFAGRDLGDGTIAEYCMDITDRKHIEVAQRESEANLRASEARMHKALSIETVGVLFFTLDGRLTDANAAFLRMSGYGREELLAITDWSLLTPREFMEVTRKAAGELAAGGETAPYEKEMIRKDGTRFWGLFAPTRLSESGPGAECVEFIIDITERKRAEAVEVGTGTNKN